MFQLVLLSALALGAINTEGLTAEQVAQLQLQAEQMKNQTPVIPPAEQLKEYADLGQAIGTAIGSTAKELGVAADEFSKTNVGQITIFLIVWKLVGVDILQAMIGSVFFVVAISLWTYYFRQLCVVQIKEYHENGKLKSIQNQKVSDALHGTRFMMLIVLIGIVICSLTTIFA